MANAKDQGSGDSSSTSTTEKVVTYVGTADQRVIEARDWAKVGAEGQGKVVWSRANGYTVPVKELTKEAVAYLDMVDAGFVVKDA